MIHSKRSKEGYLLIDHRNSPGVPEELIRATPLQMSTDSAGSKLFETPTITCCHCQTVVMLNPNRSRPRNYCMNCDHYHCDNPGCFTCVPFQLLAAQIEKKALTKPLSESVLWTPVNIHEPVKELKSDV